MQHETGNHPESAARVRKIEPRLEQAGLAAKCTRPKWEQVARRRLTAVHAAKYADEIWSIAKSGGGDYDSDTVISPCSYDVALMAAGCTCDAAERIIRGEDKNALCLVRPPGHHALVDRAMGFCIFNNVAIAVKMLTSEFSLDRVMIVDWDIHHGNGTQEAFWTDPSVGYLSIHRSPFFPGTGLANETGSGAGLGTTVNLPVEFGITRHDYIKHLTDELDKFAAKIKPQFVLLSAGFDTHRKDPVGSLGLETEDYVAITKIVMDVADAYADGKMLSVLEGGYNPEAVAESVEVHLDTMLKKAK
ncbi:MAG: histone deacetylase [Planctomycetota bacterium]|nr:histone deacetylase [Planctomycetota bacterium]